MFDSFEGLSGGRRTSGGGNNNLLWILGIAVVVFYMYGRRKTETAAPNPKNVSVDPNIFVERKTQLPEERIINTLRLLKEAGGIEGLFKGLGRATA